LLTSLGKSRLIVGGGNQAAISSPELAVSPSDPSFRHSTQQTYLEFCNLVVGENQHLQVGDSTLHPAAAAAAAAAAAFAPGTNQRLDGVWQPLHA